MTRRQLALTLRSAVSDALPGADASGIRRWFCRLCALRYLTANGILSAAHTLPAGSMALFDGCPEILPDALVSAYALLREIPDDKWQGNPELPGWLYQYYNAPEREAALAGLRQHRKIAAEHVPAATQLFTPDWIVRCMTENTLGALAAPLPEWRYFLETPDPGIPKRSPEGITLLDPCMGCGHILAYAFDALMGLYARAGVPACDAAERILTENLHGLDIDPEAAVLCDFVLRMKALPYIPDLLERRIPTQLYHFGETRIPHAAEFGSLLRPLESEDPASALLTRQYDAVITNPPYMGSSAMSKALNTFVKTDYPAGKADLFACFMERCAELTRMDGCFTMIVQHSWMFLSRFARLRERMRRCTLRDVVHLGTKAFSLSDVGTIVQTAVFTAYGKAYPGIPALFLRLTERDDKEQAFFDASLRYSHTPEWFDCIPGKPLCYWMSDRMRSLMQAPKLGAHCRICQGMTTSDNKRFLRRWYELPPGSITFGCKNADEAAASGRKWFPYNKGGRMRRWYGNHSWVVNFGGNGAELRAFHAHLNKKHSGGRLKNADTYFQQAVSWSFITENSRFGVRYQPAGFLFDVAGSCLFPAEGDLEYLMGLLSSNVTLEILRFYNPTMNFQPENLKNLPYLEHPAHRAEIAALVRENIALAREDWDSTEESWDFTAHPLVQTGCHRLADAYAVWESQCRDRIARTQQNETRLNQIFAEIYGLSDEIADTAPPRCLLLPDAHEAAEGLVSFLLGCLFGRYSLSGIAPAEDNFLPLHALPEQIGTCLASVFGAKTLTENLAWLEEALGMGLADYCARELYPAHCKRFHKRPVYWLAVSGRQRALCGLVYIHRFGASPVPVLQGIAERCPDTEEITAYRTLLASHAGAEYRPDDGIPANLERFAPLFAPVR